MNGVNAGRRRPWRDGGGIAATSDEKIPVGVEKSSAPDDRRPASPCSREASVEQTASPLSIRAENVLKILATELTGEKPPRGRWVPSDLLLERLTYRHLSIARNCGPQTIAEIVRWAQTKGTVIRRSLRTGKSLSAMWHDIIARVSTGDISKAEIAEALENSARRGNTRIPVAFQEMLLQLIRSSNE